MLAKEILGKEVIGANGFKLGEIDDIQFDEKTWKIGSIEVHLQKDIAEEHHLRHRFRKTQVLISVDHIQGVGDRVILKEAKDELLKLIASTSPFSHQEANQEESGTAPNASQEARPPNP